MVLQKMNPQNQTTIKYQMEKAAEMGKIRWHIVIYQAQC